MALGLVGSVYATETPTAEIEEIVGKNPYTPDPNTEELWFQNAGLSTRYTQWLNIKDPTTGDVTCEEFDLGINIVEVISYVVDGSGNGTYYLTLHPEYFGPANLPYDDQFTAQYAMELQGLLVCDEDGDYVNCFYGGFPKFPDTYLIWDSYNERYYAKCIITSSIEDYKTGNLIPANWNGEEVYFEIPFDVWPTPTPPPTPTPTPTPEPISD
jgi:hypothetical protein